MVLVPWIFYLSYLKNLFFTVVVCQCCKWHNFLLRKWNQQTNEVVKIVRKRKKIFIQYCFVFVVKCVIFIFPLSCRKKNSNKERLCDLNFNVMTCLVMFNPFSCSRLLFHPCFFPKNGLKKKLFHLLLSLMFPFLVFSLLTDVFHK